MTFIFFNLYERTQGRQKTLCQGDTHLVQCTQKNKVIRMTGGFYGRSNTRTCKGDYDNTTMCGKKNNALSLVRGNFVFE